MKRKILASALVTTAIVAGLSVSSLLAQQNGSQARRDTFGNNQSTATSIAIAGSNGINSVVQTAIADGLALGNSQLGLGGSAGISAAGLAQIAKLQAEATWGMATMPLPNYLRNTELGLAPHQGLLVTQLIPGMSAASSGIELGALIVELDGLPVLDNQPLPMLQAEHKLMVVCDAGLKEICVKPLAENLLGENPVMDQLMRQDNLFAQVMPQIGAGFRGLPTALSQPAPRSLSVSQVNGEMSVSAVVDGASGPTRVELRGCRAEIIKQMSQLPAEIQSQLAPHIGL
jgi:hypothetical protein